MLTNTFYQSLLILSTFHPQSFKWKNSKFSFFYLYIPFPPSIAFTQKQNQKARHSCRAQNSQKQTRAQLSCLLLSLFPFPFNLQRSPSAIFLFTSTASLNIENQKEPQVLPSEFPMEHLVMSSSSFKRGFVGNEEGITPLLCAGANGGPACWPAVGLCAAWLVNWAFFKVSKLKTF